MRATAQNRLTGGPELAGLVQHTSEFIGKLYRFGYSKVGKWGLK
jgi:hypothetical protein